MKSAKTEESDFLSGELFIVVVRAEPLRIRTQPEALVAFPPL